MNREKAKLMQAEVCKTAKDMSESGLVAGTWGNISARIDEDYMVITPSGMDYSRLYPEQMVIVNMNQFIQTFKTWPIASGQGNMRFMYLSNPSSRFWTGCMTWQQHTKCTGHINGFGIQRTMN